MLVPEAGDSSTSTSLIERLRVDPNDAKAWEEFIDRYSALIRSWAEGWRLQPADADDLIQTVVSKLLGSLRDYKREQPGKFRSWLRVVTRNAWLDLEAKRRERPAGEGNQIMVILSNLEAREDLQRRLEATFDTELLEIAMDRIKARVNSSTWEAFRLTSLDGLSGVEAAAKIGMPVAHVFVAKHRVIKLIREELGDEPVSLPWITRSDEKPL